MKTVQRIGLYTVQLLLLGVMVTSAAAQATCPANVILALARAGSACLTTERNQACYGGGLVTAEAWAGQTVDLTQPGATVDAEAIQTLTIGGAGADFSTALLRLQADLPVNQGQFVTLLAFGDVQITNLAPPTTEITVTAIGSLNIRELPSESAPILGDAAVRDTLIANGRTNDSAWVRVTLPGVGRAEDVIGWVTRDNLSTTDNIAVLGVVDEDQTPPNAFQTFTLETGIEDAPCAGTPNSGILLQTPNTDRFVPLSINNLRVALAGTVYIHRQNDLELSFSVLSGGMITGSLSSFYFPAGVSLHTGNGMVVIMDDFNTASLALLPTNLLPLRFAIPDALTLDEIATAQAAYVARTSPTAQPQPVATSSACVRVTRRAGDLRAGPGENYEIVNSIREGVRIAPVLRVLDANGGAWIQLQSSNWISTELVIETGICDAIPTDTFAQAPDFNYLSLETCESNNGAIRAGQLVTIDFVPPAFETITEATAATRIDSGRIQVENRRLSVTASSPVPIGDGRYIRTFSTTWRAESGTFRITGRRLSYELICDITVPLE